MAVEEANSPHVLRSRDGELKHGLNSIALSTTYNKWNCTTNYSKLQSIWWKEFRERCHFVTKKMNTGRLKCELRTCEELMETGTIIIFIVSSYHAAFRRRLLITLIPSYRVVFGIGFVEILSRHSSYGDLYFGRESYSGMYSNAHVLKFLWNLGKWWKEMVETIILIMDEQNYTYSIYWPFFS